MKSYWDWIFLKQCNITQPHFPHTGIPHPKCTCSFNRPWFPSLNGVRTSTELFIHGILFLMVTPISRIWTSQLQSPQIYGPATTTSTQPPHPHFQIIFFLVARGRSKENLSVPGVTQENLEPTFLHPKIFIPLIYISNKKMTKWYPTLTLRPPSLI